MTPEISSVADLRSGIAAVMLGVHFATEGSGLRITEIVLVGRGVAAFLFKQTVTSITFVTGHTA
jgi:hypothetical protein